MCYEFWDPLGNDGGPDWLYPYQQNLINTNLDLRDEDPEFFSTDPDPDPAQLKKIPDPDPTWNRNEEKNIFIF